MTKQIFSIISLILLVILLSGCHFNGQSIHTHNKGNVSQHTSEKQVGQATQTLPKTNNAKQTNQNNINTVTQSSNESPISSNKTGEGQSTSTANPKTNSQGVTVVSNPKSVLVLVNKTHELPGGYVPPNLIIPNVAFPYTGTYEKMYMRAVAGHALEKMFHAAKNDGIILYAQSGYRSFTTQKAIFAMNVKNEGLAKASQVSAHPGTSEHQTGLAMDITSADVNEELIQKFGDTKEGKWVAAHAHDYGFIIRYPKGDQQITGYEYEPWHLRYVGVDVATYIFKHHITFEQYSKSNRNKS